MNQNKDQIAEKKSAEEALASSLANQALNGVNHEEIEVKPHIEFDPKTHARKGLAGFPRVQIETLGHVTLTERVTRILTGEMDFHAADREFEFDEDEGNWNDKEPEFDPTNDLLDKTDIHDMHKELIEKLRAQERENVVATKVEPTDKPLTASEQSSQQSPSVSAAANKND